MARAQGHDREVFEFDARPGGGYRMAFVYEKSEAGRGKSTEDADVFTGRFIKLVPEEKIVEAVQFESADPAFAGTMTITTLPHTYQSAGPCQAI